MTDTYETQSTDTSNWQYATDLNDLRHSGVQLTRVAGKQIALFDTESGIKACDNRCPHEGYPLSEGNLSKECVLTCNWHNWKFNLDTGENLFGGDRLRIYPIQLRGEEVWIDIADPPFPAQYKAIIENLKEAFEDYSYDRISREIARLLCIGADPRDALRWAIDWSWQKMEFGWTHAYAGMADWLTLYLENSGNLELQLVCLQESVAHTAFDVQREKTYPFTEKVYRYDETRFLSAIENEDEGEAIAIARGALNEGFQFRDLERALSIAALNHYNDFGHSLIYVSKAGALIELLGQTVLEPLLLSLIRSIVFATREDKIPEFRHYKVALKSWNNSGNDSPAADNWHHKGIKTALNLTVDCSQNDPRQIYEQLLLANAFNLLHFDIEQQEKIHVSVSGNVGWLDFTHGLTFANAVNKQCSKFPDLWPQGLLQMACFVGRNAAFTTSDSEIQSLTEGNMETELQHIVERVLDHGQGEHIVSVHLLKTTLAVREEVKFLSEKDGGLLTDALKKFINGKIKRRQTRRTAYQSLQFVSKE